MSFEYKIKVTKEGAKTIYNFSDDEVIKLMFIGKQRAGKDTSFNIFKKYYSEYVKQLRLADGIYFIAEEIFDMKKKDRNLLIKIGQQMRAIDEDVFIKYTIKRYKYLINNFKISNTENLLDLKLFKPTIIITDVRLKREYDLLIKEGFKPIYICATQEVRSKRPGYSPEAEKDKTEQELNLEDFDYYFVIYNNSTLEDLENNVLNLIKKLDKEYLNIN